MRDRDRARFDVRLHDMRHTRTTEITTLLPAIEAQAITGHKDIRMLLRYYHASADELGIKLRNAMDAKVKKQQQKEKPGKDNPEFEILLTIAEAIGIEKLFALKDALDKQSINKGE